MSYYIPAEGEHYTLLSEVLDKRSRFRALVEAEVKFEILLAFDASLAGVTDRKADLIGEAIELHCEDW